jgi:DNA repair protein RecO (recombination protein O)
MAASNIQQQPALVLHVRPYRETSSIVQFFTPSEGRIVGVMKGLRRDNPKRVGLQAFSFGTLAFIPRDGLVTVRGFDLVHFIALHGEGLYAGFYVLELLSRLLPERQSEQEIFTATMKVLERLEVREEIEPALREFEMDLLQHLGFGINFSCFGASSHNAESAIDALKLYSFNPDDGFVLVSGAHAGEVRISRNIGQLLWGHEILAIKDRNFSDLLVRRAAKKLLRDALAPILGDRPLISRTMHPNSRIEINGENPDRS